MPGLKALVCVCCFARAVSSKHAVAATERVLIQLCLVIFSLECVRRAAWRFAAHRLLSRFGLQILIQKREFFLVGIAPMLALLEAVAFARIGDIGERLPCLL